MSKVIKLVIMNVIILYMYSEKIMEQSPPKPSEPDSELLLRLEFEGKDGGFSHLDIYKVLLQNMTQANSGKIVRSDWLFSGQDSPVMPTGGITDFLSRQKQPHFD